MGAILVPELSRFYCGAHWTAVPKFDDGFFDCIVGSYLRGHHRTLSD